MIRKQEEDYTAQVDEALPLAVATATGGDLSGAIEKLLPLEKKARIASDSKSTARILEAIVQMVCGRNVPIRARAAPTSIRSNSFSIALPYPPSHC